MSVRAAPNYGTELPIATHATRYLSLYQSLKNTGLLQHQSFLQLVILLILLYAFNYHRSSLDNHHELTHCTSTGFLPIASFSCKAYNTLSITLSTIQSRSFRVTRTYRTKVLRSLFNITVSITSAPSFNIVSSASQVINHSQRSFYSGFFARYWQELGLLPESVHPPRSSTSSLDPIRNPILPQHLKICHAGFSRIRTGSASQVRRTISG